MDSHSGHISFPCSCSFPSKSGESAEVDFGDTHPDFAFIDIYEDIEEDCPAVWELLGRGMTRGCFQLEGNLGRDWSEKIKPRNLDELSDLVSLIRPGCLKAYSGNPKKSMTVRYADRKNQVEDVTYIHESLEPILKSTQGVLISQEQSMMIAQGIAGFDLQQADILRRAIGKKKADVMKEMQEAFLKGCREEEVVDEEIAKEIFSWIRESQRYSFNKCLSIDTEVETPNGFTTLQEIKVGDLVKCPTMLSGSEPGDYEFVEVLNKYDQGKQHLYEVIFESKHVICCTLDHKILCENEEIHSLLDIFTKNLKVSVEGGKYTEIDYIENMGVLSSLDIEVDNYSHLFYAGGVATSNSHGISYGKILYWTAYMKTHFPLQFFRSYINGANDKGDKKYEEIRDMVYEAKLFDIEVKIPTLKGVRRHTFIKGKDIFFGLRELKGVGETGVKKILENGKPENWISYLLFSSRDVSSTVNEALIKSGVLDCYAYHVIKCYMSMKLGRG